jgi:hypothetical protein
MRPVLVEFKAVPFYRENIGQLLEYRTQVMLEISKENSLLRAEFGEMLSSPVLCLVVPNCEPSARVACSLSGIDVYEYENSIKELTNPSGLISLRDFDKALTESGFPISADRYLKVDDIYKRIQKVITDFGLIGGWTDYRAPSGEYWYLTNHLFINKWLFRNVEVSFGIYEVIINKERLGYCCIEFFSKNKELLQKFMKNIATMLDKDLGKGEAEDDDDEIEYYHRYYLKTLDFSENLEQIVGKVIKIYNSKIKELGIEM